MIKLKSLLREELASQWPDKSLDRFLLSNKVELFSGEVYHGSPMWGLGKMLLHGIHGEDHGEISEHDTFSTSVNPDILHLFSEGEGDTGLAFNVKNVKVMVLNDILTALLVVLPGSGMVMYDTANSEEFEKFVEQYKLPFDRGEYYLPYGYLSSLGVDAFMYEYVWKRPQTGTHHNDESEVCFIGKGVDKLNKLVTRIYVDGNEYDITDKKSAIKDIKDHLRSGKAKGKQV